MAAPRMPFLSGGLIPAGSYGEQQEYRNVVLIVCVLLAVGAMGFTLLVREGDLTPAPEENPELKHMEARRQVLYENLKDLQFEYHQGKLSDEDYQSLKAGFLYDLASVMDSLEQFEPRKGKQSKADQASRPVPKTKPKQTQSGAQTAPCPSCGSHNSAGNHFCGHCGALLQQNTGDA